MAKYIVDLPDAYTSKSALLGDILSIPIYLEGGKRYGVPTGIKLAPYTEPDSKAIEDEIWELADYMCRMDVQERDLCFGFQSTTEVTANLSCQEAKSKFEAWTKQKDEICVGDEVIYNSRTRAVVLKPETKEKYGTILTSEFDTIVVTHDELEKTGRHFPEITELLKKMRDTDEG